MRNILATTGLILIALFATGCASAPPNLTEAYKQYDALDDSVKAYEPVGDAKLDGLARPFVTSAIQLKADVEKEVANIKGSPIQKLLGNVNPENASDAFAALKPEERAALARSVAESKKADEARIGNLVKQMADLAAAGVQLAVEIQNASKGGGAGAAGFASTLGNALSEEGTKAVSQVKNSFAFCEPATAIMKHYRSMMDTVEKANEDNARKAQS